MAVEISKQRLQCQQPIDWPGVGVETHEQADQCRTVSLQPNITSSYVHC